MSDNSRKELRHRGNQGHSSNQNSFPCLSPIPRMEMDPVPAVAFLHEEMNEKPDDNEVYSFPMNSINNGEIVRLLSDDEDEDSLESYPIQKVEEETFWSVSIQIFIPFLIAGFGMVGAGLILDIVQVKKHRVQFSCKNSFLKPAYLVLCPSTGQFLLKFLKCLYSYLLCLD